MKSYLRVPLLCLGLGFGSVAWGQFVVEDIRVEGLERIAAGTVFNYLPVSVGGTLDEADYPTVIRALFDTGLFSDVGLARDGDVLVVTVAERPAIAELRISGNKDITTEDLQRGLTEVGLAEGRTFDRSLLEKMEQELLRQYYARGKYAVKVESKVDNLERNRVAVALTITEGSTARIKQIRIIGNQAFREKTLLDEFALSTSGWLSFITKDDQYSKQKLEADLERLRSFYLDQGYLKFTIDSSPVSISADKKDIYITVNVTEGERYTVKSVALAGDLIVPEEELRKGIEVAAGDVFSRASVAAASKAIIDRLGVEGYAFANVNAVPDIDEATREVALTFAVDPGRRVYVRRIEFQGNLKTQDQVLRRETRQAEGAWYSSSDVNLTKTRLERLEYLEEVNVETPPVAGTTDQVDVVYSVKERPAGSVTFGVGYGQESGVMFNAGVSQSNFMGTGNKVDINVNTSRENTVYSFGYENPYYTLDGVSRGFEVYYKETDAGESNVADYVTDSYGGSVKYGIPFGEFDRLGIVLGLESLRIKETTQTPSEISDFLIANGDDFVGARVELSYAQDNRNRVIFPDRGMLNRVSAELMVPGSDLEFYKLGFRHQSYYPLTKTLTLRARAELGYGAGLGDTEDLPFFENFYAGGLRTVRGYKANTLGPRYASTGEPSGGAIKAVAGAEVIFPVPFLKDSKSFRLSAFVDGGNVFSDAEGLDVGEFRYSVGVSALWLTPIGPLALSLAEALNAEADDETETFQFSIGVPF